MATTNTYLTFNGNCEPAFDFYKSVFGGEFTYKGKFNEMPPQEGQTMSEEDGHRIMHVSLPIGSSILMGSDTGGEWAASFVQGNNFSVSVTADSKAEADKLFEGLSAGGHITVPISQTFWGDYFGMCADQFGIQWMVSFKENKQS